MNNQQRAAKHALIAALKQALDLDGLPIVGVDNYRLSSLLAALQNHDEEDYELNAEQLDEKYNSDGDGEHPRYTRNTWKDAVYLGDTFYGYWDWVEYQLDKEGA